MPIASQRVAHDIAGPEMPSYAGRIILDRRTTSVSIKALIFLLQLLGLCALNFVGVWAVEATRLPIPGNLVGMVGLYLLLSLGMVKVSWFDATGSFLIKHLAFFFIPVTVGLMDSGGLLALHGVGIAVILVASATIGILLSGLVSQFLIGKPSGSGGGQ
jgi:holin-like protein